MSRTCLGHVTEAISGKIIRHMKRTLAFLKHAPNVFINVFSLPVTHVEPIQNKRHSLDNSRKFLSMLKKSLEPKHASYSDVYQHTPSIQNAHVTSF